MNREFGDIVFASQATQVTPSYQKEDIALLEVVPCRCANNQLRRVKEYHEENDFNKGPTDVPLTITPPSLGLKVAKVGIRTGYTTGKVVSDTRIRFHPSLTADMSDEDPSYHSIPVTLAKTIQGDDLRFSHRGDSGALLVTFERGLMENVIRTSTVGILYAVLLEGASLRPTDAFFYPMADALQKLKKETGLDLVMDDEVSDGNLWNYEAYGGGRSTYGLK